PLAPDERQAPRAAGTPRRRRGVAARDPARPGRGEQAALPPGVDPAPHEPAGGLHGGGRASDPVDEAAQGRDPEGFRGGGGGAVRGEGEGLNGRRRPAAPEGAASRRRTAPGAGQAAGAGALRRQLSTTASAKARAGGLSASH